MLPAPHKPSSSGCALPVRERLVWVLLVSCMAAFGFYLTDSYRAISVYCVYQPHNSAEGAVVGGLMQPGIHSPLQSLLPPFTSAHDSSMLGGSPPAVGSACPTPNAAATPAAAEAADPQADKKHYRPPCERLEPGPFDQSATHHRYPDQSTVLAAMDAAPTTPRVAIVTYISEAHYLSSRNSLSSRSCYAARHGYWSMVEGYNLQADRVCHWNKLRSMQKYLPYYDWLLWADADVLFVNHSKSLLRDIITPIVSAREAAGLANTDVMVQVSNHGMSLIDAGTVLIRNTEWGRQFLQRWIDMSDNQQNWYDHDNGALHVALQDSLPTNKSLNCTSQYENAGAAFDGRPLDNRACWTQLFDADMPYDHVHILSFPHPAQGAGYTRQPASGIRLTQYGGDDKVGKMQPDDFLYHTKDQMSFFQAEDIYCY